MEVELRSLVRECMPQHPNQQTAASNEHSFPAQTALVKKGIANATQSPAASPFTCTVQPRTVTGILYKSNAAKASTLRSKLIDVDVSKALSTVQKARVKAIQPNHSSKQMKITETGRTVTTTAGVGSHTVPTVHQTGISWTRHPTIPGKRFNQQFLKVESCPMSAKANGSRVFHYWGHHHPSTSNMLKKQDRFFFHGFQCSDVYPGVAGFTRNGASFGNKKNVWHSTLISQLRASASHISMLKGIQLNGFSIGVLLALIRGRSPYR